MLPEGVEEQPFTREFVPLTLMASTSQDREMKNKIRKPSAPRTENLYPMTELKWENENKNCTGRHTK